MCTENTSRSVRLFAPVAVCIFLLTAISSARAATLTVTTLNDSGPGSLRGVISAASTGDTITFAVNGTITLTTGPLDVAKNLDIEGPGATNLAISGNHASRVFVIEGGAAATLAGMTISSGVADSNAPFLPGFGGGILNFGNLTVSKAILSDNLALGTASPGLAISGGIANFGTLQVKNTQLTGNVARGGDGSTANGAGQGIGGAIGNFQLATATVSDSQLIGNVARGGNSNNGVSAGLAFGGAIGNEGNLTVSGSTFSENQAIGGNNNLDLSHGNPGGGIGGAIFVGGVEVNIQDSGFDHNQAIGGNGNPFGGGGFGGAFEAIAGVGTISGCILDHNQAIGGAGGTGADGGVGVGGGLNVGNPFGTGAKFTISSSTVDHNSALGGPGGNAGNDGNGQGGGIASEEGAILFAIDTTVEYNDAQGGLSRGGNGGNGLGGGLFEDATSTLSLKGVIVRFNIANSGSGLGIGGGVYQQGAYGQDIATVIDKNRASTSNDNLYPDLVVVNYHLVSQQSAAGTQSYLTYSADLINSGRPLGSVTATLMNLDPFKVRVAPGQGSLTFSPVPAGRRVGSKNTFTIMTDSSVPFDPTRLQWTFQTSAAAPVAIPGPNQTVKVGSTVTLDGSGSSNPSDIGTLSYTWVFISRPPGTRSSLFFTSTAQTMFVPDVPGNYVLTLTVDNGTASSNASVTITSVP